MNKWEKELAALELKGERSVLNAMKGHYQTALERVYGKIDALSERDDLPGIRQRRYQEALAEQIGGIIDDLEGGAYSTLEGYLQDSYEDGFIGTLYSLQKQGIPLAFPIDRASMARSTTATADGVKLSKRVYSNTSKLQKQVIAEITRGFAQSSHVAEVAGHIAADTDIAGEIKRNVKGRTDQAMRRAMTIARTEKGRVLSESRLDAMRKAKAAGADVVKQWDSTLDGRTRKSHRKLDGQIREIEEPFEINGHKAMAPHKFGRPEEDINCRCACLQRARAALEMPEGLESTKWDGVKQCHVDISDAKSYGEFKAAVQIKTAEADIGKLTKSIARYNKQIAALESNTYEGIWREPVTVKDYADKKAAIPKKLDYFKDHISEDEPKFKALVSLLADFESDGKKYENASSKQKDARAELAAKRRELATLKGEKVEDDPFSEERKAAAMWAKTTKEADSALREVCGGIWKAATTWQRDAIFDYTKSYSKFNEPLRGIEYGTEKFVGVGKVDFDAIGVSYSGFKRGQVRKEIEDMTDLIEKSTYDFDMWMQRGCSYKGMDNFFKEPLSVLQNASQAELEKLMLGKEVTEHAFCSCGVSKGKGFSSNPIILNIYAPEGTKMMYAEPFSKYGKGGKRGWDGVSKQSSFGDESEIILQQGTRFRIIKVERTSGTLYVDLEVIDQSPQR